jgi:4'-phosphopantetheinyl transferase EntD
VIASLFEAPVVTVTATEAMWSGKLFPEEEACIRRAVVKRRREFTAGRLAAREALARLGIHDFPLLSGESRLPLWPEGVVGSISHCAGACGVAVAPSSAVRGVGLDLERADTLEPELAQRICREAERARFSGLAARLPGVDFAKLTFCAKESFYKCWYPITGVFLGFHDVDVEFEPEARRFRARLLRADAPSIGGRRELSGRFAIGDGIVASGVSLAAG